MVDEVEAASAAAAIRIKAQYGGVTLAITGNVIPDKHRLRSLLLSGLGICLEEKCWRSTATTQQGVRHEATIRDFTFVLTTTTNATCTVAEFNNHILAPIRKDILHICPT